VVLKPFEDPLMPKTLFGLKRIEEIVG